MIYSAQTGVKKGILAAVALSVAECLHMNVNSRELKRYIEKKIEKFAWHDLVPTAQSSDCGECHSELVPELAMRQCSEEPQE